MVGTHLAHYRIVEKVGAGGMGVVYRAHDEQLERDVAIKVLPAGSLQDADARKRFKQEALVLARINHPNIATLFGAGSESDVDFLVMEFIPGMSLADRLLAGPVPIPEVIGMAAQIAEGLAAAHQRGIIHRDLKPGNIRLTPEGRIKILDFGLAQRAPRASDSGATITVSQVTEGSGTLPYMSPELLRGQITDERSDVWGVGMVLYELCAGKRPFRGTTPTATAADIIHREPPALRSLRSEVPAGLEQIIRKCLEKEPANRYQSATALKDALVELRDAGTKPPRLPVWLVAAVGVALLAAVALVGVHFFKPPRTTGKARRSVAVLGFRNLRGVASQDWISIALSEMLTTELAAGEGLRTVSGEDVARARVDLKLPESESLGQATLQQLKARLGSDVVVAGSYLDLDGHIRVDARVQDTSDGTVIANLSESGPEDQLFAIVARAGAALRAHVGVGGLTSDQLANVRATQPANLAAARLYAEGLAKLRQFDAAGACEKFAAASDADPKDALVHAALASAWSQLGYDARAAEQARIASELSTGLAREDRLAIEGAYYSAGKQWDKAIDVYRTLFGFFPDRVDYGLNLVDSQVAAGKAKDGLDTITKLRAPGVGDPSIDLAEARASAALSDYRRARDANARAADTAAKQGASFERALALQQQCWAHRNLGQLDEAREAGSQSQAIFEENRNARGQARSLTCVGIVLSDKGDVATAKQMFEKALSLAQSIGAQLDTAGALINIGNMLAAEVKIEESTARYQKALEVARLIDDKPDQQRAQSNIGVNLMILGELRQAQTALESALEISRAIGAQQSTAETLINLASVYLDAGTLSRAESSAREALSISRSLGLRADVAASLAVVGDIQLAHDDLGGAALSYSESAEIRKQTGDPSEIAASQLSLATLAVEKGNMDYALRTAQDAVQKSHQLENPEQEAAARILVARILLLENKADLSQVELNAVSNLAPKDRISLVATDIASAQLLSLRKKPVEAERLLRQVFERAKAMNYSLGQLQAKLALGEAYLASEDSHHAAQELRLVVDESTKLGLRLLRRKAEHLLNLASAKRVSTNRKPSQVLRTLS